MSYPIIQSVSDAVFSLLLCFYPVYHITIIFFTFYAGLSHYHKSCLELLSSSRNDCMRVKAEVSVPATIKVTRRFYQQFILWDKIIIANQY